MMGGRNVQHLGISQRIRQDTPGIHGCADGLHPSGGVDFADLAVAGVFDAVHKFPAQQLDQQIV